MYDQQKERRGIYNISELNDDFNITKTFTVNSIGNGTIIVQTKEPVSVFSDRVYVQKTSAWVPNNGHCLITGIHLKGTYFV